jgi:hypothetical protein
MNDFNEIEKELKTLRPIEPSPELFARIEAELGADAGQEKVVRPARFRISWFSLGAGLAAAALLLVFARLHFQQTPPTKVASNPPSQSYGTTNREAAPTRHGESSFSGTRSTSAAEFVPARATEVVYRTQDEGLVFPAGSNEPLRRVRARMRETLQWQNPQTGASLRVSYPAEEVTFAPVYGQ